MSGLLIAPALDVIGKVIDRVWPDPTQAAAAKLELLKMQQSGELAQITAQTNINTQEAQSDSLFVAGWRPAIGWICGIGLASQYIIAPFATWAASLMGKTLVFPTLDTTTLMPLLLGMLGLGGLRTYEKVTGATKQVTGK